MCAVNDGSHKGWEAPPDIAPGKCAMCGGTAELVKTVVGNNGGTFHVHVVSYDYDWHGIVSEATGEEIAGNYDYEEGGICSKKEDAVFIAAARTDVPRLCRAVRELMAALEQAVDWFDEYGLYGYAAELESVVKRWQRGGDES